jgi:PmbA protein
MAPDYKGLSEDLVKRCLQKGAGAAESYIETGRNLSLEVRNGDIETVQEAADSGAGIRVFVKGRLGFASSNDLRDESLDRAVSQAVTYAGITTSDPANVLPEDRGVTPVSGLYDPEIAALPMDRKIELARNVEKLAMKDPRITRSAGSGYGESEQEVFLANSNGLVKSRRSTACGFGVSVVAEKGGQKSSGGKSCNRRFFADLKSPEEVAAKAARDAYEMLDPRKVKTQRAAVVFDSDAAYALLGGILRAVNGESVLQGASYLAGRLGQKIGSELLTLIDDGTLERGSASAPFDGEGVPTRKRVIVDKGVLRGFMYNTVVARRAGVQSTGNASRPGFTSLPGIGSHNFYLANGPTSPEAIVAATGRGLLVKEVTGYGINPVNGNFSGGASGFWIEKGTIAYPVKGLTIAGTAEEILNGLDMVANDRDPFRSMAGPTFRVAALQIGGR